MVDIARNYDHSFVLEINERQIYLLLTVICVCFLLLLFCFVLFFLRVLWFALSPLDTFSELSLYR